MLDWPGPGAHRSFRTASVGADTRTNAPRSACLASVDSEVGSRAASTSWTVWQHPMSARGRHGAMEAGGGTDLLHLHLASTVRDEDIGHTSERLHAQVTRITSVGIDGMRHRDCSSR